MPDSTRAALCRELLNDFYGLRDFWLARLSNVFDRLFSVQLSLQTLEGIILQLDQFSITRAERKLRLDDLISEVSILRDNLQSIQRAASTGIDQEAPTQVTRKLRLHANSQDSSLVVECRRVKENLNNDLHTAWDEFLFRKVRPMLDQLHHVHEMSVNPAGISSARFVEWQTGLEEQLDAATRQIAVMNGLIQNIEAEASRLEKAAARL